MKFNQIYRHGDVIIFRLSDQENPFEDKKLKKVSKLTLALGEVTGHSHLLQGELEVLDTEKDNFNEVLFKVEKQARLTHEEHDVIVLEKGLYLKVNQVEFDPFEQIIRYVRD